MGEPQGSCGPQFRADRPVEREVVRTTIVGGRPPGSGQSLGEIPRGIDVLIKKASVDPAFKQLLLEKRAEAAEEIGLTLDPAEAMMLRVVPDNQLQSIIAQTRVPDAHRRAFLGKAAAAMLAALGVFAPGCNPAPTGERPDLPSGTKGVRPDRVPATTGSDPGLPPEVEKPKESESEENRESGPQRVPVTDGIRPDRIPAPTGNRADLPPPKPGPESG